MSMSIIKISALTIVLYIVKKRKLVNILAKHVNCKMVDYKIAEIAGLEAVFHDIKVYLCDFHREQ